MFLSLLEGSVVPGPAQRQLSGCYGQGWAAGSQFGRIWPPLSWSLWYVCCVISLANWGVGDSSVKAINVKDEQRSTFFQVVSSYIIFMVFLSLFIFIPSFRSSQSTASLVFITPLIYTEEQPTTGSLHNQLRSPMGPM